MAGPDFTAPADPVCYRHPDRPTGIRCQRCRKPICGECMNTASVGFQCPRCVSAGQQTTRTPRSLFGANLRAGGGIVTKVLMGILVATFLLDLPTGGLVSAVLEMAGYYIETGQFWRLLTYGLITTGSGSFFAILGLLMNLLVLWMAGRSLESELGSVRFAALYLIAGLGGATVLFLVAPTNYGFAGSTTALVGLLGANAIFKRRTGEDIRPDITLLVLLVLLNILAAFNSLGWIGLIGGIVVGAIAGATIAYAPRDRRGTWEAVGLASVAAACLVAIAAKLVLFS
ncbi:rhomboid family intramembrane serine protease [Microlunatus parietis]|uniref:Membrane associated rhomboid family serine protease n=1 Tax=Microlunatus parietis TaxID=682979 RepID=A0A7Y9ID79_9ACTN|nr:rhomboid family intramembrane serine protease [Microlunatus parietis]NYE74778.1 membrane associated rhomboid family serine protease [Microlunatus parietis]